MRTRKWFALLMAIAMMVTVLAGCGAAKKDTDEGGNYTPDWTAYDALIKDIYQETDLEAREAKMHQAEDMLMETGAVIPIYYYNDLYLEKPEFSGDYSTLFGTKYFMYAKKNGQPVLASNSFVGLYTSDANDNIVPALADGMPIVSEDGTQYTINLKTWQKWSNGDPLTAEDFVYSWKRAADPNTASDYGYLFDVFKKDDKGEIMVQNNGYDQIQFTLNAPCPYMMNLLAFPVYMPVHKASVEAAADWQTNPGAWTSEAGFVSNGAYTLKEWKHNESMVYVKNPNYYDAANVSVDELHFMLSADDTAILAAYKAGNLDYADTVPNGEIPTLKNWPDFHVIDNLGTYYVGFNVKSDMFKGKTPDQANKMRRALALLVNRQYIIDTIGQTQQEPATSFIPTGMSDSHGGKFKENDANYTYPDQASKGYYSVDVNVQGAIDLLKEAGFEFDSNNKLSASTPIHINYLTNEGTGHEGVAQALQQDFAQIGITMDISVEDWQTFLNDRKSGNFDVAREGWLADYDDPINMLEMFTSDSGNNDMQLGK